MAPTPGQSAKEVGPASPTLARLGPGFVPHDPLVSYYLWLCLILDILKICMDFGPFNAFSVIRCSWNGRSIKLVELVSNKHPSSISWIKFRYVGDRYVYFMTANSEPLPVRTIVTVSCPASQPTCPCLNSVILQNDLAHTHVPRLVIL
jgi:hypothetical protein